MISLPIQSLEILNKSESYAANSQKQNLIARFALTDIGENGGLSLDGTVKKPETCDNLN